MVSKKSEFCALIVAKVTLVAFFAMFSGSLEAYHESGDNYGRGYYHNRHVNNFRNHWRSHLRNGNGWNHHNHSYWSYDGDSYGNNQNQYYDLPTYYYYVQPDNTPDYYYETQPDQVIQNQWRPARQEDQEEQYLSQEGIDSDNAVGEKENAPLPGKLSLFIKLIAFGHLDTAFHFVKSQK